jgi:hypothetical protein
MHHVVRVGTGFPFFALRAVRVPIAWALLATAGSAANEASPRVHNAPSPTSATLALRASCDGDVYATPTVVGRGPVGRIDGATRRIPARAVWELVGDPLADPEAIHFAPSLAIHCEPDSGARSFAHVWIDPDAQDAPWARREIEQGLLLFGWLHDGHVTRLHPAEIPSRERGMFPGWVFELEDPESKGIPFAVLRRDDRFVPPASSRESKADKHLLAAMLHRDHAVFESAWRTSGLAPRSREATRIVELAVLHGREDALRFLFDAGVAPPKPVADRYSAYEYAAEHGRLGTVALLLERHPRTYSGRSASALHRAIATQHQAVAVAILDSGVNWGKLPSREETPWQAAARHGLPQVLRRLIELGAERGETPDWSRLFLAWTREGWTECARLALERAVDPLAADRNGPAFHAALASRNPALVALFVDHLPAERMSADRWRDVLLQALQHGDDALVVRLLELGAANHLSPQDRTDFVAYALQHHRPALARYLAGLGARVDVSAPEAAELIELAVRYDEVRLLERAFEDGWSESAAASTSPPLLRTALRYGASQCRAWLEARVGDLPLRPYSPTPASKTAPAPFPIDLADECRAAGLPIDADTPDRLIRAFVDSEGRLQLPVCEPALGDDVERFVLRKIGSMRFTDAAPVAAPSSEAALDLAIEIGARRNAVHSRTQVDLLPVLVDYRAPDPGDLVEVVVSSVPRHGGVLDPRRDGSRFPPVGALPTLRHERVETTPLRNERVAVRILVEVDGRVSRVAVLNRFSSDEFVDNAVAAIRAARFEPGMRGDTAVRTELLLDIRARPRDA